MAITGEGEDQALEREVAADRREFVRGLRKAFPDTVRDAGDVLLVQDGDVQMEIALFPLPDRCIAQLRLPNMRVRIQFTSGSRAAQLRMLSKMDQAMHRGGG